MIVLHLFLFLFLSILMYLVSILITRVERQFKIERENQLLLQKMIRILKQTPQWFDESVEKRITDNRKKSVEDRRKQESERIATENRVRSSKWFTFYSIIS